jgi:AbrB family looped-hinge helix DNA binding protein
MWYTSPMAHNPSRRRWTLRIGARGRLVLPAPARKALSIREGDPLVATLAADGRLVLVPLAAQVRRLRGMFRTRAAGRRLSEELIRERREEAARDERG